MEFLKAEWKKVREGYRRAVEKRVDQTKSGAASTKLATCRHFNLLSFLYSTVISQATESNVEIPCVENESNFGTPGNSEVAAGEATPARRSIDMTISSGSNSNSSASCQPRGKTKRKSEDVIDTQLRESLNNVNDAVKAIAGASSNEFNRNEMDSDMYFCQSLVSSLRSLPPRKNKLARIKIQQVLYDLDEEI